MRTHASPLLLTMIFCFFSVFFTLPTHAAIKCWTNNEGIRECGDRVPPEYAQQGHQELSNSGMIINEQERVKTEEELQEQARKRAIAAAERRKQAEADKADRILLATFSSAEEIELVRDDRIRVIQASISLAEKQNEGIQQKLERRIQVMADAKSAGNPPSEASITDIDTLRRQIKNKQAYITNKQIELEQTSNNYTTKIDRFRHLKGL